MRNPSFVSAAVLALLAGCSGEDASPGPQAVQPAAPNTGFFAFLTVAGQPRLYFPAPPTADRVTVAVVDAAAPHGASGLLRYIDLGAGATPAAVGADGDDVVVVEAESPTVWFISASAETVRGTASLPVGSQPYWVSGNLLYGSGVAVDSARRRAWVSASTGLVEYDLDTRAVTASFASPPTENFAYDPVARTILSPFYLCDPAQADYGCTRYAQPGGPALTDSVTVVDLTSGGQAYALVDPFALTPAAPLGYEPDSVAFDTTLGVAVVAAVEPPAVHVLELGASVYDGASMTCNVPVAASVPVPPGEYAVLTVDPNTHLALVAQELGSGIAFVDLVSAVRGDRVVLLLEMPPLPDGSDWITRQDPHGVGVGVIGGRPYAFLSHVTREWMARVDLTTVAAMTLSGGSSSFASAVSYFSVPIPP